MEKHDSGDHGVEFMTAMTGVSVLILTRNEQQDLPACLASVSWCDDVHVYDSMSADDTVAIAEGYGARVTQRGYEGTDIAFGGDEAANKNWGLRNIPFKHPWVLQLDADERSNPSLVQAIERVVPLSPHSAYRIRRRDFLNSTWLKHVQTTPYCLRLFRPEQIHFERLINAITITEGSVGDLNAYFDHFPFGAGLAQWIDKHNCYSTLEARQIIGDRNTGGSFSPDQGFHSVGFPPAALSPEGTVPSPAVPTIAQVSDPFYRQARPLSIRPKRSASLRETPSGSTGRLRLWWDPDSRSRPETLRRKGTLSLTLMMACKTSASCSSWGAYMK